MLRHGTGIPATATAVELIGLLIVPMSLAGFFRDACYPGEHLTCLVPDVGGPARWMAYGAVGLVTAIVYYVFAKRRAIYAYIVAPMVWAAIGALGLYLEDGLGIVFGADAASMSTFVHDGMSGWQLIAVLVAMALSIALATRYRDSGIGKVIAVPTVRIAVVAAPFVLALSFVLAVSSDSLGGSRPTFSDLGATNMAALFAVGALFAFGSRASFASEGISARLQRESAVILRAASYIAVGAAWVMTATYELSPAWIGLGLVGYAISVAAIDRLAGGSGDTAIWIARVAGAVGLALTLIEPLPALIGWLLLASPALLAGRARLIDRLAADLLPMADNPVARRLALWIPLLVAIGDGAARLAWPRGSAWVLAGAAAIFTSARLAKNSPDVTSLARIPAITLGMAAVAIQVGLQIGDAVIGGYELGGLLVAVGLVTIAVDAPWALRLPVAAGLLAAGTSIILREAIVTTQLGAAFVDTAALGTFGLALITGTLLKGKAKGLVLQGGLGHTFVLAAIGRSLAFEQTALLGLSVVAVAYAAEAIAIETGRGGLFAAIAAGEGRRSIVAAIPTLVVTVVMIPIALLIGRHVPLVSSERARFGPVLSAVSWIYLAAAMVRRVRVRRIVTPFADAAAAAGVLVAVPSVAAIITTMWSAAAVTTALAIGLKRPYATTPSWAIGVTAAIVTGIRFGIDRSDTHFALHVLALGLVAVPAGINVIKGRGSGLTSAWLRPPVASGMLLLPATIAMTIHDGRHLALVTLAAAAVYGWLGWSTRTGGVSIPIAFTVAIAYANILFVNGWAHPFDEPVAWMPLAALYVGATAVLPGN